MDELYQLDDKFRNSIATVDEKGKRIWVYPKKPKGTFHTWRAVVAAILLLFLISGPFLRIHGNPLLLINVFERKFILFGIHLWPQDFHILALMMITMVIFIVLFTVIYGRVWCGWACPQTIFMEMVFRKIEYLIEGDLARQRKLDRGPWTTEKIFKKSSKHLIFILISLIISHTFMAYLLGTEKTAEIISQPPTENLAGFISLLVFTGLFYFVFAYLREQVCVAVCPYGRLQGVFLGNESVAVIYDWLRGEPRARIKKGEPRKKETGDCIDCKMCYYACPTGIDIRNGTQLECVNCTACMDACDEVMTKIHRPKGLIKYASYNGIKSGNHKIFTTRVIGYSIVLVILVSVIAGMLLTRQDVEATVLKVPGQLYQEQPGNRISNLYNIQFINKTLKDIPLELKVKDISGATVKRVGDEALNIQAEQKIDGVFFIELPRSEIHQMKTSVTLQLLHNGKVLDEIQTSFVGPASYKKQ